MVEHVSKRRWMVWCEGYVNLELKVVVGMEREWKREMVFLRREPTVEHLREPNMALTHSF